MKILSSKCPEKLIAFGNTKLVETGKYMNANQLVLNESKTQYMIYKPKGKSNSKINSKLKMNSKEIEQVKSARYLGVIFDDEMSFKEQFLKVKSKLIQGVKALICTMISILRGYT